MIEDGIVDEDSVVELLRGVIVRKDRGSPGEDPMGHSPLHRLIVALLTALAGRINSPTRHLQIQLPISCPPDGAPEPDATIIKGSPRDYVDRLPGPGEISCIIEAAHSSLQRDREDKLPIYAAAGVPQYIIINLFQNVLEVHSDPDRAQEEYRTKVTLQRGGTVSLLMPDGTLEVAVSDLFP
jgi:Uma2 family endonuclease